MEGNPLLEPENYFKGYESSVEQLKNNPELFELDRLCYEVLEAQEAGRKLLELLTNRFLLAPTSSPGSPSFSNDVKFGEGLRYAFLLLRNSIKAHKQRIAVQGKK